MKNRIGVILVLALCLAAVCFFAACGDATPEQENPSSSEQGSSVGNLPSEPTDTPEGVGGEFNYEYEGQYSRKMKMFSVTLFRNVCGDEAFQEWVDTFNKPWQENDPNKRPYEECNLLSFIEDFNVSKEDFKTYVTLDDGSCDFTDEEIDLMYSGTKAQQAAAFANPNAVVVGENIYTPKWIATHSAQEIQAAGITSSMLAEKAASWEKSYFSAEQLAPLTQAKTALQAAEQKQ